MEFKKYSLKKSKNNDIQNNNKSELYKIIPPVSSPDSRSKKSNIAIPSDSNAELSKKWVDFNKL